MKRIKFKITSNTEIHGKKDYVSCGDYQSFHIELFRKTILKKYGKRSCSQIQRNSNGFSFLDVYPVVNMKHIVKVLGISCSGPSSSSSSK